MLTKEESGCDIHLGDQCSEVAYSWAKKSFANRKGLLGEPLSGLDGSFSNILDYGSCRVAIASDGIGTKIELSERLRCYDTIGFDLVAMICDDLICNGCEPLSFSNILDVDKLDRPTIDSLMRGLSSAANFAKIAVTGGEIAELGSRISGYGSGMHFNWCATGVGILPGGRAVLDGSAVKEGDAIISLKSRGFRSNGFSLIRKILQSNFGDSWHNHPFDKSQTWGEVLLTPSLIYTPLVIPLLSNSFSIHAIAHITGGGLFLNLARALKRSGFGASLSNIFEPFPVMKALQEMADLSEEQAYELWNMGNGMLLIIDHKEVDRALDFISNKGYEAQLAGEIVRENLILLKSKGRKAATLFHHLN